VKQTGVCGNEAARKASSTRRIGAAVGAALALCALGSVAAAASTPAGTVIQASAEVTYVIGTQTVSVLSNAPSLTVNQLIDVAVGALMASVPVQPAESSRSVAFRVVNTGNAPETLHLQLATAVAGNVFDALPHRPALYLDADASGTLSGADQAYAPGANDPVLAPGAAVVVLALVDVPAGLADGARGRLELSARVGQASGAPGTVFPGAGSGGVDAIAGLSGGSALAGAELLISGVDVALLKSATVVNLAGGSVPQSGSRIDYDIAVQVRGRAGVHSLVVVDPIPASTRYLPASLQLDGIALGPLPQRVNPDPGVPRRAAGGCHPSRSFLRPYQLISKQRSP